MSCSWLVGVMLLLSSITGAHASMLSIGDKAPDFQAHLSTGETVSFHEWIKKEGGGLTLLLSHPHSFTPVCTTELAALENKAAEFRRKGVNVIGLSADSVASQQLWLKDVAAYANVQSISYPLIADEDLSISKMYGMLPADAQAGEQRTANENYTVRSVFVINNLDQKIEATINYPMEVGRSFDELNRLIDALTVVLTSGKKVATAADWVQGEKLTVNPQVSDEEARGWFDTLDIQNLPSASAGYANYLRFIPYPDCSQERDLQLSDANGCGKDTFIPPCHQCSYDGSQCFWCSAFTTWDSCEQHNGHKCGQAQACNPWCPIYPICEPN